MNLPPRGRCPGHQVPRAGPLSVPRCAGASGSRGASPAPREADARTMAEGMEGAARCGTPLGTESKRRLLANPLCRQKRARRPTERPAGLAGRSGPATACRPTDSPDWARPRRGARYGNTQTKKRGSRGLAPGGAARGPGREAAARGQRQGQRRGQQQPAKACRGRPAAGGGTLRASRLRQSVPPSLVDRWPRRRGHRGHRGHRVPRRAAPRAREQPRRREGGSFWRRSPAGLLARDSRERALVRTVSRKLPTGDKVEPNLPRLDPGSPHPLLLPRGSLLRGPQPRPRRAVGGSGAPASPLLFVGPEGARPPGAPPTPGGAHYYDGAGAGWPPGGAAEGVRAGPHRLAARVPAARAGPGARG